jgi:uncharacterized protein (DUF2267 family)
MANTPHPTPEEREHQRAQRREARVTQTYLAFLDDLCDRARIDRDYAEQVASSVLCALEQRLTGGQVGHLEAQLPAKLRALLVRCARHQGKPPEKFGRDTLVRMVCDDLLCQPDQAEWLIRSTCAVLATHVSEGEIDNVVEELPEDVRTFFRPLV